MDFSLFAVDEPFYGRECHGGDKKKEKNLSEDNDA